ALLEPGWRQDQIGTLAQDCFQIGFSCRTHDRHTGSMILQIGRQLRTAAGRYTADGCDAQGNGSIERPFIQGNDPLWRSIDLYRTERRLEAARLPRWRVCELRASDSAGDKQQRASSGAERAPECGQG